MKNLQKQACGCAEPLRQIKGSRARRGEGNEEGNEGERHAVQGASLVANMAAAGLLQVSLFLIVRNVHNRNFLWLCIVCCSSIASQLQGGHINSVQAGICGQQRLLEVYKA